MNKFFLILGLMWINNALAQFLPQTEDIPLMQGITIADSSVFSFDSPSGQILTIDGKTGLKQSEIQSFYAQTLPSLGWTITKQNTYVRGTDSFAISFPHQHEIHFEITLSNNKN